MQTGRLQDSVRDRALAIIEQGGDVDRWREESATLGRQREKVLRTLGEKLRGPQPAPKTIRRPKLRLSPLDVGDVVRVRGARTGEALFVVVDIADTYPPGSTSPVVAGLLWDGDDVPDDTTLAMPADPARRRTTSLQSEQGGTAAPTAARRPQPDAG